MFEKLMQWAEGMATRASLSRRGFFEVVGRRAVGLAAIVSGVVGVPAVAQGGPAGRCRSNADCGVTSYCQKKVGRCDDLGRCVRRPEACLDIFDPVCGCDGRTYGNACYAAAAGVSILGFDVC